MKEPIYHKLEETISAYVRPCRTALRLDQTVGEALATIRGQDIPEKIIYFYVLDHDSKPVGVLPTRKLLVSRLEEKLASLADWKLVCLTQSATVEEACQCFLKYRYLAIPVVDDLGQFIGVLDISLFSGDLFDIAERHSYESAFQLIGIHVARDRSASPWLNFKDRFPWLLCNIAGGLLCAFLASFYEKLLDHLIILALFIPVVLTLSESVSIQAMTITLQGFHDSRSSIRTFWRALFKEFLAATLLGFGCGVLVGLTGWLWKGNALACMTIGVSIFCAIVTASLLGVALPYAIHVLKKDPQVAAGPIVLAIADLCALLFFFNLAALFLR